MNTYITLAEAQDLFPNAAEYTQAQKQLALNESYSLVNSYLNSELALPALDNESQAPGILKIGQVRFFQWILESANQGYTEELNNLYDANADMLSKITQNELIISEIQDTQKDIGWNLYESELTSGSLYIKGTAPLLETVYLFEATAAGFDIRRNDSDTVIKSIAKDYDWQPVTDGLEVRLFGDFIEGQTFKIIGIPDTKNVVSANPVIKQSEILY